MAERGETIPYNFHRGLSGKRFYSVIFSRPECKQFKIKVIFQVGREAVWKHEEQVWRIFPARLVLSVVETIMGDL